MCFSWTNSAATDFIDPDADFNSSQLDPHPIERLAHAIRTAVRIRLPILDSTMGSPFTRLVTLHYAGMEGGLPSKAGILPPEYAVIFKYGISTCHR
jgi:hypothetical protein